MQNWYRLLEQAGIILKLFYPSRLNPKLLLYVQLIGTFFYNRTPIPPPWHKNPSVRQTTQ